MQIIWHIVLTVCLSGDCAVQDVQWFDEEQECKSMLHVYRSIPTDGDWDTIDYVCKPVGSVGT